MSEATGVIKTPVKPGAAKPKRPPGLLCETCARRVLARGDVVPNDEEISVFQLKLRDWLNVERVELRPCLSVCPTEGMTVERRGKTMVLNQSVIDEVSEQFDPSRQLPLFISRSHS